MPPAMYRSVIAEPASSPPTNPPPGRLCPANSSQSDISTTAWNTSRTDTSTNGSRRSGARRRWHLAAVLRRPPSDPRQRHRADRGDGEHGDLAQGVEAAEVDEDHVDDVAAVPVGDRPLPPSRRRPAGSGGRRR